MNKSVKAVVFLLALVSVGLVLPASAQDRAYTPLMLCLVTPLQVPPRDFNVGGLRINAIYGECHDFDGLDLSLVGRATGHANGFQAALLSNVVEGDGFGLQAGAVASVLDQHVAGSVGLDDVWLGNAGQ